jgi:tetratricopeptide (TPR) repeat protein
MNHTLSLRRSLLVIALAAVAGCATAKPAPEAVERPARAEAKSKASSHVTTPTTGEAAGPSARTQRAFDDAVTAFQSASHADKADWADVERKFKQVVAMDDTLAEAQFDLGVVYEREHKKDEAAEAYRSALARKPSLRQAAENLAVLEENAGHQDKAIAMYQDMAQKYPQDGASRARIASLYAGQGQGEQALKLAREALMRDPKNVTAYKVMMRVYLEQKNFALAELVALRATRLDANDPELYFTMGLIALEQKDEVRAIEQFRHALKEREDFLPARVKLASIATQHHDYSTAAAQFEKLVQYQPKSAAAHLDLGIAYKGMGQVDKAFQQYEEVKKLDETNAEVYYAIGVIFEKNKSVPEKALENYKIFIQKSGAVQASHPVYESIKTCEQLVALAQQAKQQEEEDKRKAEVEKKYKEQEEKNKAATQKTPTPGTVVPVSAPAPGPGAKPGEAAPAGTKPAPAAAAAPGTTAPVAAKPAPTPAAVPAPAAAPAPVPVAKPAEKAPPSPVEGDEPPDAVK